MIDRRWVGEWVVVLVLAFGQSACTSTVPLDGGGVTFLIFLQGASEWGSLSL
jgi:hypothetical protein